MHTSFLTRSVHDRELLAIYASVKRFKHWIEGRNLTVYTDRKPLTFAFSQKLEKCSPRQFRYLDFIAQYTTNIKYIKGTDNDTADCLSRVEAIWPAINYDILAKEQITDEELRIIVNSSTYTSLNLKKIALPDTKSRVYCDIANETIRPYVPKVLHRVAFNLLHNISHPGIRATQKLITDRYVWPSINKNCRHWA
jgi:hypothetical protein